MRWTGVHVLALSRLVQARQSVLPRREVDVEYEGHQADTRAWARHCRC
jgi:hypothetical protein